MIQLNKSLSSSEDAPALQAQGAAAGRIAPSTTLKPGFTVTKESGWAAMTITITVRGYEV